MDRDLLAEKVATVERHLSRVNEKLPASADHFEPVSDASDAVILHLWQAVQTVIDVAVSLCVEMGLGAPDTYGASLDRLVQSGFLDQDLGERLQRAAGFRNLVAHAYTKLNMQQIHRIAQTGPADLRAFLRTGRNWVERP